MHAYIHSTMLEFRKLAKTEKSKKKKTLTDKERQNLSKIEVENS
jgi:hypothetical protein